MGECLYHATIIRAAKLEPRAPSSCRSTSQFLAYLSIQFPVAIKYPFHCLLIPRTNGAQRQSDFSLGLQMYICHTR